MRTNKSCAPNAYAPDVAGLATALMVACLMIGMLGCAASEDEAAYPNQPIKLVVPFGAGGGTDTYARLVKKTIEDHDLLPQPLVIINRGGAGATIGSRFVKDAEPDGYTLLILHDALMSAKYSGSVNYGPESFTPVAGTGSEGMIISVAETSPYQSLNELLAATAERPDEVTFGANMGALTHFAGVLLQKQIPGAQFRFAQIGGGADRFAKLKGEHIDVTGFSIEEFVRFRSSGLRGLAYLGDVRHPGAPDVPTAREQGIDVAMPSTFYWWFPKGTPQRCVDRIAKALEEAMQTEYLQQKLAETHRDPIFVRGEPLRERIALSEKLMASVDVRDQRALPNFPLWVFCAVVGMGGWAGLQGLRERAAHRVQHPHLLSASSPLWTWTAGRTVACVLLLAAYIASLEVLPHVWPGLAGVQSFGLTTVLFFVATGLLLTARSWARLGVLLGVGLVLAISIVLVFTRFLETSLPS